MSFHGHHSSLDACPAEVLERVALALASHTLRGPPNDIPSLLRVSKTVYSKISIKACPTLYSTIFAAKFDDRPAVRRLGKECKYSTCKAKELVQRFISLKRFKFLPCEELFASDTAPDDLWIAYLLFLENDKKNYEQLVHYAGVDRFSSEFVMRLGGPIQSWEDETGVLTAVDEQLNALAAWLFWFTDKGSIHKLYVFPNTHGLFQQEQQMRLLRIGGMSYHALRVSS